MDGVLLYDGGCGICAASARWLRRHAPSPAQLRPWAQSDLALLGVSGHEAAEAVQWVTDGWRATGPAALAAYLQTSSGPWRVAGRVLAAPVSLTVAWPLYRWLVQRRSRPAASGGRPAPRPVKGVRRRRAGDLGSCARLLRVVFADGQYPVYWPEAPRAWLADEEVLDAWVFERRGEILGHVAISRVGLTPVSSLRWREITGRSPAELAGVSRLFVRPRVRGEGVGSVLLDVAVAAIRARGLTPVLEVVSASRDAIRLYEDRGWRLVGMYDWGRPADRLRIFYYVAPEAAAGAVSG